MARGDYIEVRFLTGQGTDTHRITAKGVGGSVNAMGIDGRADFITVNEYSRSNEVVQAARFARGSVVSVIEGHSTIARAMPTKAAK